MLSVNSNSYIPEESDWLPDDLQGTKSLSKNLSNELVNVAVQRVPVERTRLRIKRMMRPTVTRKSRTVISNSESGTKSEITNLKVFQQESELAFRKILDTIDLATLVPSEYVILPTPNSVLQSIVGYQFFDTPPVQVDKQSKKFIPSVGLVKVWLEGRNAYLSEAGEQLIATQSASNNKSASAELARNIRKIINNFGKRKAYDNKRYRITFGGNFLPSVETLFADHLMLPPRVAPVFLDILLDLLYEQSKNESVFYGRWGNLIIDESGELTLALQRRRQQKLSKVLNN